MNVSQETLDKIKDHQGDFPDMEVVGFILEGNEIWPMVNISEEPDAFVLDPIETRKVLSMMEPIGMYHTHIHGESIASNFDLACVDALQLPMLIVDQEGKFSVYDPD